MKLAPILWLILILSNGNIVFTQSNCYTYSQIAFNSKMLNEKIKIGIFIPESYDNNLKLKPIYVLDGDYLAPVVAASIESLSDHNRPTPCLVIAMTSTNRQRDFTPKSDGATGQMAGSGGADHYLEYVEKELIPMIELKFNADTHRIIIGHSIGGLLAYYSILKNPALFHSIISIDGSLWWNEGRTGKAIIEKLTRTPKFRGEIFECRKDILQPVQFKPNLELLKYLAFHRPAGLHYHFLEIKNATHASIVYPGIYYGVKQAVFK